MHIGIRYVDITVICCVTKGFIAFAKMTFLLFKDQLTLWEQNLTASCKPTETKGRQQRCVLHLKEEERKIQLLQILQLWLLKIRSTKSVLRGKNGEKTHFQWIWCWLFRNALIRIFQYNPRFGLGHPQFYRWLSLQPFLFAIYHHAFKAALVMKRVNLRYVSWIIDLHVL